MLPTLPKGVGLDAGSVEDIRTAALLFNMNELGITNEVLCKAAQVSQEDLQRGKPARKAELSNASAMGGSLRRAIPIFLEERQLRQTGTKPDDASLEVQILVLAEEYESLISGNGEKKLSPAQAGQEVMRRAQGRYDSLIVDGFTKNFRRRGGERKRLSSPQRFSRNVSHIPTIRAFKSAVSFS